MINRILYQYYIIILLCISLIDYKLDLTTQSHNTFAYLKGAIA